MYYVIYWIDTRTQKYDLVPGEPYHLRAAADAHAVALDLQYPHREHTVIPLEDWKNVEKTNQNRST